MKQTDTNTLKNCQMGCSEEVGLWERMAQFGKP